MSDEKPVVTADRATVADYFEALIIEAKIHMEHVRIQQDGDGKSQEIDTVKILRSGGAFTREYLENEEQWKAALEYGAAEMARSLPGAEERMERIPNALKYEYLTQRYREYKINEICSEVESLTRGLIGAQCASSGHWEIPSAGCDDTWRDRHIELLAHEDGAADYFRQMSEYCTSGLVYHDACQYAVDKIEYFHPGIAEAHKRERAGELEREMAEDPVNAYGNLVERYARRYAGVLGHDLAAARDELLESLKAANNHRDNKPPLSAARKVMDEWSEGDLDRSASVDKCSAAVRKIERLREDAVKGLNNLTLDWGVAQVAEHHPELARLAGETRDARWEDANRERLDRQAGRIASREESSSQERRQGGGLGVSL